MHEDDIDHGGFVNDEQVTLERVALAPAEQAAGLDFQQAVN